MLGNKREKKEVLDLNSSMEKSNSQHGEERSSEKNEFNFTNQVDDWYDFFKFSKSTVLDLDLLHKTVSPPSELYQSDDNSKTSTFVLKIGKHRQITRKSDRVQKKEKNNLFQFINCHQCKKIDNSINMVICSHDTCRESYCFNCIKKYFVIDYAYYLA